MGDISGMVVRTGLGPVDARGTGEVGPILGRALHYREALCGRFAQGPVTRTWFDTSEILDRMEEEARNTSSRPHRFDPLDKDCHFRLFGIRVAQVLNGQ